MPDFAIGNRLSASRDCIFDGRKMGSCADVKFLLYRQLLGEKNNIHAHCIKDHISEDNWRGFF